MKAFYVKFHQEGRKVDAEFFEIIDGHLVFYVEGQGKERVASFAPGFWSSVIT